MNRPMSQKSVSKWIESFSLERLFEAEVRELLARLASCRDSNVLKKREDFLAGAHLIDEVAGCCVKSEAFLKPPVNPHALRIVHWNVDRGKRVDAVMKALSEDAYLKYSDVVIMTETDIGMARSGNRHIAEDIAKALGFSFLYVNSYVCLSKGTREELFVEGENQYGLHGITLFSRYPIEDFRAIPLPTFLDKMRGGEKRLGTKRALVANLRLGGGAKIAVVGVHLDAKSSPSQRRSQMRRVLEEVESFVPQGVPIVGGGDLNTTTYSSFNKKGFVPSALVHFLRGTKKTVEEDYLFPERYYETLFQDLTRLGFSYEPFNEAGVGTLIYDQNDPAERAKVREHVPEFLANYLKKKLEPYGGKIGLKVDWFFGRDVSILHAGDIGPSQASNGYLSENPRVLSHLHASFGQPISDHVPIGVDLRLPG